MGDGKVVDGMIKDGLTDVYSNYHMGVCAELCSEKYKISREQQVTWFFKISPFIQY
jgi:acetyl-CoA C-acetyltransferase